MKTIGIVVVAALAASAATVRGRVDDRHLAANQIGRQRRQAIILTLRPAVFDADIAVFDIAGVVQALAERRQIVRSRPGRIAVEEPDHRQRRCCARAASGHAAAAPPRRVMNSRRRMTGLPI